MPWIGIRYVIVPWVVIVAEPSVPNSLAVSGKRWSVASTIRAAPPLSVTEPSGPSHGPGNGRCT